MSKEHEHTVIVIRGLSDQKPLPEYINRPIVRQWENHGLQPVIHTIGWHDQTTPFETKLRRLTDEIDRYATTSDCVSLVGISAGGPAALNAFFERKNIIHRVITVCSRLSVGSITGMRGFDQRTKTSPAFAESLHLLNSRVDSFSPEDRQRIMTVRAMFGDELVPPETAILEGAYNTRVPTAEHVISIGTALTICSEPLIVFLKRG